MGRKGLNRECIAEKTLEIISEKGMSAFSLRSLAGELGVKTASLYNHIKNINDLYYEAGIRAIRDMEKYMNEAVGEKKRDEAICAVFLRLS